MRFFGVAADAGRAAGELFYREFLARPELREVRRGFRLGLGPRCRRRKYIQKTSKKTSDERNST